MPVDNTSLFWSLDPESLLLLSRNMKNKFWQEVVTAWEEYIFISFCTIFSQSELYTQPITNPFKIHLYTDLLFHSLIMSFIHSLIHVLTDSLLSQTTSQCIVPSLTYHQTTSLNHSDWGTDWLVAWLINFTAAYSCRQSLTITCLLPLSSTHSLSQFLNYISLPFNRYLSITTFQSLNFNHYLQSLSCFLTQ